MKHYTLGLLRHRCSNAMRIGKFIHMYKNTFARANDRKHCPNCSKKIPILLVE